MASFLPSLRRRRALPRAAEANVAQHCCRARAHHAGRHEKRRSFARARRSPDVELTQAAEATMKSALVLAAAANALVAPSAPAASTVVRQAGKVIQTPPILTRDDGLETRPMAADMPGVGLEMGGRLWDPMGFATFSDESLIWFRACELKHSRVAMLACAGWIVNGLHLSLPGTIDYSTKFSDLAAKKPLDAWAAVPVGGKLQILGWIFCVECASEMQKPHYLKGGEFVTYDWANLSGAMSAESLKRKQEAELKNGRLAMIGFMSFLAANNIEGSVPMVPHSEAAKSILGL